MFSSRMTSTLFAVLLALTTLLTFGLAAPAANIARDIWSPKVLTPNEEVGWVIGTLANVTWDTSNPPAVISNGSRVQLVKGGIPLASGPGSTSEPLAEDFDLLAGFVEVTVPDIEPGNDYQVVLFGDSGNIGPLFSISEPTA
ncbi:hypothetical protein ACEPAF_2802 [Sanghuangporus sanghuang]